MQDKNTGKLGIILEDMRIGGPQKQLIYFLQEIEKQKVKLNYTLILPKNSTNQLLKYFSSKIDIEEVDLEYLSKFNFLNYLVFFLRDFFMLKKKLKNIFKVYIAGGTSNLKSLLISIFLKKKIYFHIHDTRSNFFIKLIVFLCSYFINKIFFASSSSKNYYQLVHKSTKSVILRSSVNPNYYKKDSKKKNNFTIGIIANINPDKNFNLLLSIIKNINDKNIKFKIVGKLFKSQKKYFKNQLKYFDEIKDKIIWYDDINEPKEIMNSFDILLCTSSYESLPLSIIESLSMSTPVISTDVGDISYVLNLKKCGLISEPVVYDFISSIYYLKNNKNILEKFSNNARQNIVENFNIENYTKNLIKELS